MKAYTAFRTEYLGTDRNNIENFEDFAARKLRYSLLYAMYENTAYSDVNTWAQLYKSEFGLYEFVRGIYNPTYRLAEFWRSHLWGGGLDLLAGDGTQIESALPIVTDNNALREPISQVWRWSNWAIKKDVLTLWGTTLGDVCIRVNDDIHRKKVYLSVVHPSEIADLVLDEFGNVKGYVIEQVRDDPRPGNSGSVVYSEVAYREGENVVYETYLGEALYEWNGVDAQWTVPYGFVPLVMVKHNDVGLNFGLSEAHASLGKFREVDDQASKLHDQVRKLVDSPWLFIGMSKPTETPTTKSSSGDARNELPALYTTNANAKAQALVNTLDIAAVSGNIQSLLKEIERDFPELCTDLNNASEAASGRALRIRRGPVEDKVKQRRPNYDDAMIRANQMAVAIGGMRGYLPGFDLRSYEKGLLDHSIGDRSVFKKDPLDDIETDTALWQNAKAAKEADVPLEAFLTLKGWSKEKIRKITDSPQYKMRMESSRLALEGVKAANEAVGFREKKKPGGKSADQEDATQ